MNPMDLFLPIATTILTVAAIFLVAFLWGSVGKPKSADQFFVCVFLHLFTVGGVVVSTFLWFYYFAEHPI